MLATYARDTGECRAIIPDPHGVVNLGAALRIAQHVAPRVELLLCASGWCVLAVDTAEAAAKIREELESRTDWY